MSTKVDEHEGNMVNMSDFERLRGFDDRQTDG